VCAISSLKSSRSLSHLLMSSCTVCSSAFQFAIDLNRFADSFYVNLIRFPRKKSTVRFDRYVFTAQRYASAVYAVVVCPSVCHTPALYQNGQYLAIISKTANMWTQLLWNANKNSYALYRRALFSVSFINRKYPKPPHFRHFVSSVISTWWVEIETSFCK